MPSTTHPPPFCLKSENRILVVYQIIYVCQFTSNSVYLSLFVSLFSWNPSKGNTQFLQVCSRHVDMSAKNGLFSFLYIVSISQAISVFSFVIYFCYLKFVCLLTISIYLAIYLYIYLTIYLTILTSLSLQSFELFLFFIKILVNPAMSIYHNLTIFVFIFLNLYVHRSITIQMPVNMSSLNQQVNMSMSITIFIFLKIYMFFTRGCYKLLAFSIKSVQRHKARIDAVTQTLQVG